MTEANKLYEAELRRAGMLCPLVIRWWLRKLPRPITRRNFYFCCRWRSCRMTRSRGCVSGWGSARLRSTEITLTRNRDERPMRAIRNLKGGAVTAAEVAEAMGEQLLAPGVYGNYFDTPNGIYIPVLSAERPGSGDVARFLDGLPKNRTIKFPTVLANNLRGMLLRRGFIDRQEFAPEYNAPVEIMVREATAMPNYGEPQTMGSIYMATSWRKKRHGP